MKKGNKGIKMVNVGILRFNKGDLGGIEKQILNIVSKVKSKDINFILITDNETAFAKEFKKYGKVYYINSKKIFKSALELKKIIKADRIDIIQSHMLRESYIASIAQILNAKFYSIFRIHTYIDCSFIRKYKKNIYHIISHILSSKVDLYLPINIYNYEELIKRSKINKNKIEIIHDGVKKIENAINANLNLKDIVMIANFNYGKGHDVAIKALSELMKESNEYNITFIGGENGINLTESILENNKNLAKKLGVEKNVKFLGFIEDIGEIIQNKSIVILPSYMEGTPNCLLEAMSAKKIVIASNVGGIPEFVIDGKTGFLHESKDYKELAQIILNLKNLKKDKIEEIEENAYEIWEKSYSVESMCNKLEAIYLKKGRKKE